MSAQFRSRPQRKKAPPLDKSRLYDLATRYVARYATSTAKLRTYLHRKLRERGWDDTGEPDVEAIVTRFVELGYIDDEAYARTKAGGLLRRGYGARRVGQALYHDGIEEEIREGVAGSELELRQAAMTLGKKRRFGPFASARPEPATREKQLAAMIRAGHSFDHARAVLDCESEAALQAWVDEGELE